MTMLIYIASIALLVVFVSWIEFRKCYYALKIPGPFPLPIVGNGLIFLNKKTSGLFLLQLKWWKDGKILNFCLKENFKILGKLLHDYGDTVAIWLKSDFHVLLSDASSVEVSTAILLYFQNECGIMVVNDFQAAVFKTALRGLWKVFLMLRKLFFTRLKVRNQ